MLNEGRDGLNAMRMKINSLLRIFLLHRMPKTMYIEVLNPTRLRIIWQNRWLKVARTGI